MSISFLKNHLLILLFLPVGLLAQKKDTLKFACLLNDAIEQPMETQSINLGQKELKIVLASSTDTLVKSCADVVISTIEQDADDGTWEILFQHKNYWFWLSGLNKIVVRKGQKLKTGEVLGHLAIGKKIELLLYDFETPIDPKKYLNCWK